MYRITIFTTVTVENQSYNQLIRRVAVATLVAAVAAKGRLGLVRLGESQLKLGRYFARRTAEGGCPHTGPI